VVDKSKKSKISASILADSINTATGDRLTTFRILCPKFILAEINTHRMLSRNFSSSRAVPSKKMRQRVIQDPVIPVEFGKNQKGMQSGGTLSGWRLALARQCWLLARYPACLFHWLGELVGLHKQVCNRIIEPWVWAEGVVSATEWDNFFELRCHKDAQPEFRVLAEEMKFLYDISKPWKAHPGHSHLPFVRGQQEHNVEHDKNVSAARCARVSFYLRDGKKSTLDEDLKLCKRLAGSSPKHLSPFEHVATALPTSERVGNFVGWQQYRKEIE
jgi:hypothetical protein